MTVPLDAWSREAGQTMVQEEGFNYTCGIKVFQASPDAPRSIDFAAARDFPADRAVPGFLCQAARLLVGLTQQELHVLARVSKKSINDYENGFIAIRVALAERLAAALRGAGARFIAGEGFVGVIVNGRRAGASGSPMPTGQGEPDTEGAPSSTMASISLAARPSRTRRAKLEP